MGSKTGIEWTDATWNPVYGCTEVSPGCDHCYARSQMEQYGRAWKITRAAKQTFYAPLKWKEPRRIFTCSWSDLFHPRISEEWLQEIWDIMLATPQHTYQVLTKRPGRMAWWASSHDWPDHVWAGTSVENEKYLPRLAVLKRVPAKVRFVSAEPLLGPLALKWYLAAGVIDWVIVGGESGPQHRRMNLSWLEDIGQQCTAAGVPVFIKQDSGPLPGRQGRIPDGLWAMKQIPGQVVVKP